MTLGEELAELERERGELESEVVRAQRDRDRDHEVAMFDLFGAVVDRLRQVRAELEAAARKEGIHQ